MAVSTFLILKIVQMRFLLHTGVPKAPPLLEGTPLRNVVVLEKYFLKS
jgi:hypothetical protein